MKKITTLLVFAVITTASFAQHRSNRSSGSFAIGAEGSFNTTWMVNSSITAQKQVYGLTFGGSGGLTLSSYFNDNFAVALGILYSGYNQGYSAGKKDSAYKSTVNLKAIDLPLTLLIKTESGSYVEVGGQFGIISGPTYSRTDFLPISNFDETKNFSKFVFSGILGFGMEGNIGDEILYDVGFRFSYGLSDLKGVDGFGIKVPTSNSTSLIAGGIHFGIKYAMPY